MNYETQNDKVFKLVLKITNSRILWIVIAEKLQK